MDDSNGQRNGQQHSSEGWEFTYMGGTTNLEKSDASRDSYRFLSDSQAEEDRSRLPLARTKAGDLVWVATLNAGSAMSHLWELGITPGAELEVVSCTASGSVIVLVKGRRFGFGASTACQILVTRDPGLGKRYKQAAIASVPTHLRDLPVGAKGCVVGFDRAFLGYMGKLLAMGIQPGTAFTVIRHALFGHSVDIEVQGVTLSLRKPEADALCVEEVEE